jgi:hypothetical protein
VRVFASQRVTDLIRESLNVASAIRAEFRKAVPKAPVDNRLLRLAETVVALRNDVLPAVEQGSLRTRPHEAMSAIEAVLAKALPQQVIVLALGDDVGYGEYELWSEIRTQLSELGMVDGLSADAVRFLALWFPAAEKDNVLLHANLCHEVGHELLTAARWADRFLAVLPGDDAIRALAGEIQPRDEYAKLSDAEKETVLTTLVANTGRQYRDNGVLTNWLGELLCDAVAICVLGPAAAFATAELLRLKLGRDRDRFNRTHPRWALRIELQRLHLGDWEGEARPPTFEDLLEDYPTAYKYLEETQADFVGEPGTIAELQLENDRDLGYRIERSEAFYAALEQALRNKLPEILQVVRDWLAPRGLLYTPADFKGEVPALITKLEALLPPSTVGGFGTEKPASYASIMNAGALVRRDRLKKFTDDIGPYRADEVKNAGSGSYQAEELIFALVRKAIADADVHRRWLAAEATDL